MDSSESFDLKEERAKSLSPGRRDDGHQVAHSSRASKQSNKSNKSHGSRGNGENKKVSIQDPADDFDMDAPAPDRRSRSRGRSQGRNENGANEATRNRSRSRTPRNRSASRQPRKSQEAAELVDELFQDDMDSPPAAASNSNHAVDEMDDMDDMDAPVENAKNMSKNTESSGFPDDFDADFDGDFDMDGNRIGGEKKADAEGGDAENAEQAAAEAEAVAEVIETEDMQSDIEAEDYYTKVRAPDDLKPIMNDNLRQRLKELKKHGVKDWLKKLTEDGALQNRLMAAGKKQVAMKRFFLETDAKPRFVNCPELLKSEMSSWLSEQPIELGTAFDFETPVEKRGIKWTDKAFVLSITWENLEKFMNESGIGKKAAQRRQKAMIDEVKSGLDRRIYDSTDGLIKWDKAKALLKRVNEFNLPVEVFKRSGLAKSIAPYRKHSDRVVAKQTKDLILKYKELDRIERENKAAGVANGNGQVQEISDDKDGGVVNLDAENKDVEEEIDDLF